jgi:hypothetical protein
MRLPGTGRPHTALLRRAAFSASVSGRRGPAAIGRAGEVHLSIRAYVEAGFDEVYIGQAGGA